MEDGSLRKFCVRCAKFAMQAQMAMPAHAPLTQPLGQPAGRETIEVPFFNGSEHMRISVYKDEIIKQMNKEIGLSFSPISNKLGVD